MVIEKTCSKCGLTKPATYFHWWSKRLNKRRPDCKACVLIGTRAYQAAHRDTTKTCKKCGITQAIADFYMDSTRIGGKHPYCKTCCDIRKTESRRRVVEYTRIWQNKRNRTVKAEVIEHYGGRCYCCNESLLLCLTIDHIDGQGAAHRRSLGGNRGLGTAFYHWLRRNGHPEGYQVACWTCNMAKHLSKQNICPHEQARHDLLSLVAA